MLDYEARKTLMIAADRITLTSTDPAGRELAERLLDLAFPSRVYKRQGRISFAEFCERYPELLAKHTPQQEG